MNKEQLRKVCNYRFADLVDAIHVVPECFKCDHFNPHIKDPGQGYRCKVHGTCIAATLHPEVQAIMWHELDKQETNELK